MEMNKVLQQNIFFSQEHQVEYKFGCLAAEVGWIYFEEYGTYYSRVHISSDTALLKILKKPSIVQE